MNSLAQVDIGAQFQSPFGKSNGATLGDLASIILSNALIIAGVIMLFLLIFGGISIIMSAGQNNPEQAAKGKQAITAAVIGFVIIFAAYWIIQLIQFMTGVTLLGGPGGSGGWVRPIQGPH